MTTKWQKYLAPGMRFYYSTTIGETTYFVTYRNRSWQIEDNHGACYGTFKTASQAKRQVENPVRHYGQIH